MVAIESNGEDGDVHYLDLKLNYLREKKKTTESHQENGTGYYLLF